MFRVHAVEPYSTAPPTKAPEIHHNPPSKAITRSIPKAAPRILVLARRLPEVSFGVPGRRFLTLAGRKNRLVGALFAIKSQMRINQQRETVTLNRRCL